MSKGISCTGGTGERCFALVSFEFARLSFALLSGYHQYPDNSAKDRSRRANDTSAKPEVRMPTVRKRQHSTVRTRQKCEGQVCEGQEGECDFSAIGQNSEMIQTVRSRSFCLQDGVWFFFCFQTVSGRRGLIFLAVHRQNVDQIACLL